jgi:hypothetical protein
MRRREHDKARPSLLLAELRGSAADVGVARAGVTAKMDRITAQKPGLLPHWRWETRVKFRWDTRPQASVPSAVFE